MAFQKPDGPATILGIGTAVPDFSIDQNLHPDYFFSATQCINKPELLNKYKRICSASTIRKRHFCLTKEGWESSSAMRTYRAPSLRERLDYVVKDVPKLAKEAAEKALKQWGQSRSAITHVVFTTVSGVDMPGADYRLVKLLGLDPNVKRVMLYQQGCFGGGTVMRVAKDIAENNKHARVLVACSECTTLWVQPPEETDPTSLLVAALFGDGAAAAILGSDPTDEENALFQIHWAAETVIPNSESVLQATLTEAGLLGSINKEIPCFIEDNIVAIVSKALQNVGSPNYNDCFWAVHAGGPLILDKLEKGFKLMEDKLAMSSKMLKEYGNMASPSVLFVLEGIMNKSREKEMATTGEGCEWGMFIGFGPGITVETVVLKSCPINPC